MGLRIFSMYFGGWSLFALNQNANQALIFGHLRMINIEIGTLMWIRRYLESSSIIRPWFEGSFKNFVTQGLILMLKKFPWCNFWMSCNINYMKVEYVSNFIISFFLAGIQLFKASNENTRSIWNLFKVNDKESTAALLSHATTRTTSYSVCYNMTNISDYFGLFYGTLSGFRWI